MSAVVQFLSLPAIILVGLTSLALLHSHNWRSSIAALALQYLGVFLLLAADRPFSLALSKLVQGWIAGAVLGMALSGSEGLGLDRGWESFFSSHLFRLLAAGLIVLVVISVTPAVAERVPGLGLTQATGALILIGLGLLQLGLTLHPFRVVLGLLSALSGFEILYAAVEISALVTGLLAAVTLGLALTGAYLLAAPAMDESE